MRPGSGTSETAFVVVAIELAGPPAVVGWQARLAARG
jgi:hypothetical protein